MDIKCSTVYKRKTQNDKTIKINSFLLVSRHAGEGGRGSRRPSCLSVGGAWGAKLSFLNAMICFLIVNIIQRRSYKLKASNI